MILYGSSFSPFVRKVLVFAAERGVALELRTIALYSDDPGFRAASPLGKMPALVDGDFSLADSTAIVTYLDALAPGPRLIPDNPRERAMTVWWDEFADTELFGAARKIFFNRVVAPHFLRRAGDPAQAEAAEREELPPLLDYLERSAPGEGGWLVGHSLTLADIAVASPLANLPYCGVTLDPARHPRLMAWVARLHARPSFATLIAGETRTLARVREAV